MNDAPSPGSDIPYNTDAPILVGASTPCALERVRPLIDGAGFRTASVDIDQLTERLDQQASLAALWLELDEVSGDVGPLLARLKADVAVQRYRAVVAAPLALLDPVYGALGDSEATILIDADAADRAAALALALRGAGAARLSDVASDTNSARLRQLSDEVNRIAATLARLSAESPAAAPAPAASEGKAPDIPLETVAAVVRARRLRSRFFPDDLFADPAWDMLLDLLQAEIAQLRVPVSSLCIAAAVPATTALRWLKTMVDQGLFVRRADPHDGRRVFVELSSDASLAMRRYFKEVERAAVV